MNNKYNNGLAGPKELRIGMNGRGGDPNNRMAQRASAQKPKNGRKTFMRLLAYIRKNIVLFWGLILSMLIVTICEVLGPYMQQKAIDTIYYKEGQIGVDLEACLRYIGMLSIIYLLITVLSYLQARLAAKLSQLTIYQLRKDLYAKLVKLPVSYTDRHQHGDLMSRMTNDTDIISSAVSESIASILSAILTLLGSICIMFSYNYQLTLIAMVTIPMIMWISARLTKAVKKYYKRQQVLLGRLNGEAVEKISSFKTLLVCGKEKESLEKFRSISYDLKKNSIVTRVFGSIMGPLTNLLGNLQYVIIASVGAFIMLDGRGNMSIGTIQAMLQYSKKLSHPINMIADQYSSILSALSGAERVFEILDLDDEIDFEGQSCDLQETQTQKLNENQSQDLKKNQTAQEKALELIPEVSFEGVDFSYIEGQKVLEKLDLNIMKDQKIALVGATGSGKTTIVNLLMRYYEIDKGSISIKGQDIRAMKKKDLRAMLSIVLQDTVLFQDSIRANIAFSRPDASLEEIKQAAKLAMCDGFISKLPDGYDTVLTAYGANLSEGQIQLIAIARAILADASILILDEATSHVDTRTEAKIQSAIRNLMAGRTSIIIAHRISTIIDADRILVMSKGRLIESGTHKELIKKKGEYAKLYERQFAGQLT